MRFPKIALATVILISNYALAGNEIIAGKTYKIVELNALDEIKSRAKGINWKKIITKEKIIKSMKGEEKYLSRAITNNKKIYIPYYTLEMNIEDSNGNTIYPKGFKYNPLDYMYIPGRIVIIGHENIDILWLKENIQAGDRIITAGGNIEDIQLQVKYPVYGYEDKMKTRLGVSVVPTIVVQKGNKFILTEHKL